MKMEIWDEIYYSWFRWHPFVWGLWERVDKFSNSKDLSNYLSGIIAIKNNQYQASYDYFKWTMHFRNYDYLIRDKFENLSVKILKKLWNF